MQVFPRVAEPVLEGGLLGHRQCVRERLDTGTEVQR